MGIPQALRCAHLHITDDMATENGCQPVTVVLMVQPGLPIRGQGLQGSIRRPQHCEGPMGCILEHG